MKVTAHVAQNKSGRSSAVPDEVAQIEGYAMLERKRKLIGQGFGCAKSVDGVQQVMVRGLKRVDQMFVLTMAAYNLVRMRTLAEVRLQGAQRAKTAAKRFQKGLGTSQTSSEISYCVTAAESGIQRLCGAEFFSSLLGQSYR
jgi:hypothetical protein